MKTIFIAVFVLCLNTVLSAQTLYVQPTGGEQVPFSLTDKPKITFGNGTISVNQTMFQLNDVQNLSFTFNQPTSIRDWVEGVCNTPLRAWITNDVLHIGGLTVGKPYRVFNISGILIHRGIAKSDVETLSASLQNGIYIVSSENQSLKIVK